MGLAFDQVDIWRISLDTEHALVDAVNGGLSSDELARANRFVSDLHRRRFIVARGWLRRILSSYSEASPASIQFQYSPHGKPSVDFPGTPLFFNLSHSQEMAICAVTGIGEIGADVEQVRELEDGIAERFFSPSEVAELHSLPESLQRDGFFIGWTRKEAYLKSRGEGLSIPLRSFDVSLTPGKPARLIRTDDPDDAPRWTLRDVDVPRGYHAAVAVKATSVRLEYRNDF